MTPLLNGFRRRAPAAGAAAEGGRGIGDTARLVARTCSLARRAAPRIVGLLVLAHLALALVPASQAWVYKLLVDGIAHSAAGGTDHRSLWLAVALYPILLLFSQAADTFVGPLQDTLNERLQGLMRLSLLDLGQRQPGLAFYDDETVRNNLETARRGLDYSVLEAVGLLPYSAQKLAAILTLAALLARLHPLLPLLLIGSALPQFRYEAHLRHYIWNGMSSRSPHWRWLNYCTRVLFSAEFAKEVRLFGLGEFFLTRYRETFERAHDELVTIRRREARGTTLSALGNACVTGGAYAAIVLAAARGRLTLGDVALFTSATFQLGGALSALVQYYGALAAHRLTLRTLYDLLDRPPMLDPATPAEVAREPQARRSPSRAPELELRDVWFSYPNGVSPVLRGIDLRITPGEKIAIVGENGAGKTTLLSLIARLYDPTGGEILADGTPLRALDVRGWRARLVSVSQEFLRLEAPLRTNLALASLQRMADDRTLWAACEQVGLAGAAHALPRALDQMLGRQFEGGVELSGGEWQKVALARALLRDGAGVVLLDEPTSALDAPTEAALFRQFVGLAADRTAILVSHRFSTVHMADRILVLEGGRVLEEGTHAALVAGGGKYAELFHLQAARYR
jgi:ATP-binding cassette subfamily B protein